MGFALLFMRVDAGTKVDADRTAIAEFLERRGLRVVAGAYGGEIVTADGRPLSFDGDYCDVFLDPLDQVQPVSGGIHHATLSDAECEFIYELCVAAGFMIGNPQGAPAFVVPDGNHSREALEGHDDVLTVRSGAELAAALSENFEDFTTYRNQLLSADDDHTPRESRGDF